MPLTRTNVTAASRRMLPTYPLFFGIIGLGLTFTSVDRLIETPAFAYANDFGSIRWWGVGFLVLTVVFTACLLLRRRKGYQLALGAAIVWMGIWALVTLGSAFYDVASFTAWAWPAFVARACWATLVSLEVRET